MNKKIDTYKVIRNCGLFLIVISMLFVFFTKKSVHHFAFGVQIGVFMIYCIYMLCNIHNEKINIKELEQELLLTCSKAQAMEIRAEIENVDLEENVD